MMSRKQSLAVICLSVVCGVASTPHDAIARPLDADQCARLKTQRDALEATGVRTTMAAQVPPTRPLRSLDEANQRIRTIIQLDGQLRFRCNVDMPIPTLKPELLVEVPDTVDGETPGAPAMKRPAPQKRAKAEAAKSAVQDSGPVAPPNSNGLVAPQRNKAAGATAAQPAEKSTTGIAADPAVVKPRPKQKSKSDDAFRAPSTAPDTSAPQ